MAIPKFEADMDIISKLSDYPRASDGLTPDAFKEKFDMAGKLLKDYINNVLIANLDQIVDVEALLGSILDTTLTQPDKAAEAKAVGDRMASISALRRMDAAKLFSMAVRSGDYVLKNFTSLLGSGSVRVYGGTYVAQGNLIEINPSSYVDLSFGSGLAGTYRNDLICGRVARDSGGNETVSIVLIPGTASVSEAADPAYNTGDLNVSGAVIRDTPLFRLKMNGVTATLERVLTAQKDLKSEMDGRKLTASVTLSADGWEQERQTVGAVGVTADNTVIVAPAPDSFTAYSEAGVRCTGQDNGTLTFACVDVPAEALTVNIVILA